MYMCAYIHACLYVCIGRMQTHLIFKVVNSILRHASSGLSSLQLPHPHLCVCTCVLCVCLRQSGQVAQS